MMFILQIGWYIQDRKHEAERCSKSFKDHIYLFFHLNDEFFMFHIYHMSVPITWSIHLSIFNSIVFQPSPVQTSPLQAKTLVSGDLDPFSHSASNFSCNFRQAFHVSVQTKHLVSRALKTGFQLQVSNMFVVERQSLQENLKSVYLPPKHQFLLSG